MILHAGTGSRSSISTRSLYQCRVTLRRSDWGRAHGFGCSPGGCFLSVQDPCGVHLHLISLTRLCRSWNTIFTCASLCPWLAGRSFAIRAEVVVSCTMHSTRPVAVMASETSMSHSRPGYNAPYKTATILGSCTGGMQDVWSAPMYLA